MVQLEQLSNIGFGSYRVSIQSKEHETAFKYAIKCGCNLVDTASNYENGNSEKLIGKCLKGNQNVFIITKAGYISGDSLVLLKELNNHGKALSDVVDISSNFKHSIHPEFLEAQIQLSLKRLNRKFIDGFLLHSPEYFFEQKDGLNSPEEYYKRIYKAFEFLEDKVKSGIIRFYGVSSNTLPLVNEVNRTDLTKLLEIAYKVSSSNNFKLIQFPFNIIEQGAVSKDVNNKSLIQIAKENNIISFANRPLNANTDSGNLRLVIHQFNTTELDIDEDTKNFDDCFNIIEEQLKKNNPEASISEFPVIKFLKGNWKNLPHQEAYDRIFFNSFYPFVNLLFNNNIPRKAMDIFKNFQQISFKYQMANSNKRVVNYFQSKGLDHLFPKSIDASLPEILCNEYLKLGIDHILVGMRKINYVDDCKKLFKND